MKIVKGNKIQEIDQNEFLKITKNFEKVVIDLGCGDGRFVYKSALQAPSTLWIGVDPAIKQTEEFARKANRNKVKNVLFVVGSIELVPMELSRRANKVYIILPWGTLLGAIAKPTKETVSNIKALIIDGGDVEIIFGYDSELEPNQTSKLELDKIDARYVTNEIVPVFEKCGFKFEKYEEVLGTDLKNMESTWGKRISLRSERPLSRLVFQLA